MGEHKHSFSSDWSANETEHWHKATCEHIEERLDVASHIDINNDGKCDVCKYIMYTLSNVSTYDELVTAFTSNDEVVRLTSDIVIDTALNINRTVTLDLNGKTISNTQDIWIDTETEDRWSLISVGANGNLTVTGNGRLKAKENDCFAVDVVDGGKLTIESGEFIGNISAIYVFEGEATIKGGKYSIQQLSSQSDERFTLNLYDTHRDSGRAVMKVSGGEFSKFNPQDNLAEGQGTNFVAQGYKSIQIEGTTNYKVVAE